jgi:hypothetical protein
MQHQYIMHRQPQNLPHCPSAMCTNGTCQFELWRLFDDGHSQCVASQPATTLSHEPRSRCWPDSWPGPPHPAETASTGLCSLPAVQSSPHGWMLAASKAGNTNSRLLDTCTKIMRLEWACLHVGQLLRCLHTTAVQSSGVADATPVAPGAGATTSYTRLPTPYDEGTTRLPPLPHAIRVLPGPRRAVDAQRPPGGHHSGSLGATAPHNPDKTSLDHHPSSPSNHTPLSLVTGVSLSQTKHIFATNFPLVPLSAKR